MDAISQFLLTENFDAVFGCIGNPTTGQHVLVPLGGEEMSHGDMLKARLGNYEFAGVFGVRLGDSFADLRCDDGPNSQRIMLCATPTFFAYLMGIHKPKCNDVKSVAWLEGLFRLPDNRSNNEVN